MNDKTKEQRAEELQRLGDNMKSAIAAIGFSAESAAKAFRDFGAVCKSKPELQNLP